jgi:hypothetical protein
MLHKVKSAVARVPRSLLLALLFSLALFAAGDRPVAAWADAPPRQLLLAGAFCIGLFVTFRVFGRGIRRQLALERGRLQEGYSRAWLWFFVVYKELIKTVIGVSFTLGWLAGLLFVAERFGDQFLAVPALLGLGVSALALLPAYLFTSFIDLIHYPQWR